MAIRGGRCMVCGCMSYNPIPVKDRNGGNGYLCDMHKNYTMSYYDENEKQYGKTKVNPWTFGVEFETSNSTEIGRIELAHMGYLPTHDGSLNMNTGVEYKSPIYQGFNALSKHCESIYTLKNDGDIVIGSECGTHLHIGNRDSINPETIGYMKRFYHSLFIPLSEAIAADPEKARKFWGRNFTHYARPIDRYTNPETHENFINLQHDFTIEFRLCKFQTAAQYQNIVRFARDVMTSVTKNFINHFNDENWNTNKYPTIKDFRIHQAQKTAVYIVRLYNKYTADI